MSRAARKASKKHAQYVSHVQKHKQDKAAKKQREFEASKQALADFWNSR